MLSKEVLANCLQWPCPRCIRPPGSNCFHWSGFGHIVEMYDDVHDLRKDIAVRAVTTRLTGRTG